MYTRQEASRIKQEFWTRYGHYMSPIPGAGGEKVNWVNYKTGIKHIFFKMDAEKRSAHISIQLSHPDAAVREQHYQLLLQLRPLLTGQLGEEWEWQQEASNEYGHDYSSVSITLQNVNIFKKEDWSNIISFFKPRIIALDQFWSSVKHMFQDLH